MEELTNTLYNICKNSLKEELYQNKDLFQQFYYRFRGIYKSDKIIIRS